jgi:hypothetical protein
MTRRTFTTIDWRRYLVKSNDKRIEKFLETRGFDVMNQVAQNIHKAGTNDVEEVAILVHPNASAISLVPKKDYIEALDNCLDWFKAKEEYEMCATIVRYKADILEKQTPKSKRVEKRKLI